MTKSNPKTEFAAAKPSARVERNFWNRADLASSRIKADMSSGAFNELSGDFGLEFGVWSVDGDVYLGRFSFSASFGESRGLALGDDGFCDADFMSGFQDSFVRPGSFGLMCSRAFHCLRSRHMGVIIASRRHTALNQ